MDALGDTLQEPAQRVTAAQVLSFLADRALGHTAVDELEIGGPAALSPGRPGCVSFSVGTSSQHVSSIRQSPCSLVLVRPEILQSQELRSREGLIAVAKPRLEFARTVGRFFGTVVEPGVSPSASVDPTAEIGPGTAIQPGAYVAAEVVIGESCLIGANAVLLPGTVVGDRTIIGPGTVIGHTGFGYERDHDGTPVPMPHSGGVRIGSLVEIGANACIDRGTLDDTVIESHVKTDNLVHIAHNCTVQEGAFVCAAATLSGGVRIGQRAWISPNATVMQKVSVGADAVVGLGSTVLQDVPDGVTVFGSPARKVSE